MDLTVRAASAEKEQLQQRYEASSSSLQRPQLSGSHGRGSGSNGHLSIGSGSVPMSEEELESQFQPSPSPPVSHNNTTSPNNLRAPTPPPYSGPSTGGSTQPSASQEPKGPKKFPGLPLLDYQLYNPPLSNLSADHTTLKTSATYISANASALSSFIRSQSTIPPKPQIHITGKQHGFVDFAIKVNLMNLLVPENPRKRMDYIRCVATGEVALRGGTQPSAEPEVSDGGLDEWARRFVEDSASVKTFLLERVVINMDLNWIEGQIRSMIATTSYKGEVSVSFPVTHAKVVVQNPDKVNKFFTSVSTLFAGKKKYEVVKAVWPFATHKSGEPDRHCAVMSEHAWWREWQNPLRHAIVTRRQGWVSIEDKLEFLMEGTDQNSAVVSWGHNI
ncbi:hypothetical protein B0H63DRAFT_557474 [Podospora didyma]|uniref:Uncharacterized protein n=1 Tax=Podospora didyma TaxID=330526 RepID=A0AAE0NZI4_9PEZI|nr:hypothetical protein B0H63DRAFT_557474 [Podospora didyma]